MKKFRPYDKFPEDIVGKVVRSKIYRHVHLVALLDSGLNKVLFSNNGCYRTSQEIYNDFEFLDGTPCGEEYEEVVELEHDKVYLVNNSKGGRWVPRHFCTHDKGLYLFYDAGLSSKTQMSETSISSWQQVCEYDKELAFTHSEPKEYLIKQS